MKQGVSFDSLVGRASAFGAGDRGLESSDRIIPKVLKHVKWYKQLSG